MTRTEGHGQGGLGDRVTGTTWGDAGGERGKEVKGMEGGKRRWKARRDELREGWLNRCPGVQSREGRGDGKTGDGDTGPLGTCCVCGLSSWLLGDRHGAAGAPQRTEDKGEEPHPEDVKSPGGRGARAGGQVQPSLEQEGRTAGSTEGVGTWGGGGAGSGEMGFWGRLR